MQKRGMPNYIVRYNSDPRLITNNHTSNILYLLDVDERGFKYLRDAIIFLSECVSPITTIKDLVPELNNCKKYKYILPERNIVVKHQLVANMERYFQSDDIDWG